MNRFLLAILLGLFLYLLYGAGLIILNWNAITVDPVLLSRELLPNFVSDIVFFGLVGLVALLAQFYGDHGDVLQQRLRKLFANKAVSLPVIDFFEEITRENCVYAEWASHTVSILEFKEDIFAYRAEFRNVYHLKNAFGDIPYDAQLSVEVAPDFTRQVVSPLAMITKLTLVVDGVSTDYLDHVAPVEVEGFKRQIRVTVPKKGVATLEMRWWSWVDAVGNWDSGFSLKRFAERFTVNVVNQSPVKATVALSEDGPSRVLEYGGEFTICDEANVAPRTRFEFYWRPPSGIVPPEDLKKGSAASDLLEFDQRIGEPPEKHL